MSSSQLKRAEQAIQKIRDQSELPSEASDALQELVDVVRVIESRISALENKRSQNFTKGSPHSTGRGSSKVCS